MNKRQIISKVEELLHKKYNAGSIDSELVEDCINSTLEAINYSQCSTELKEKENLSFKDWKTLNKYTRAMHGYYKQGDKIIESTDVVLMYRDYRDTL